MTQIASVYGEAMYSLAKDNHLLDPILEEMNALKAGFEENPDFVRLLSTPNLSKEQRVSILDDSFSGKIQPYLLNFLKILTEKGYVSQFPGCCEAFRDLYNRDMGILPVTAVTAVPLSGEQTARLQEKLSDMTGRKIALSNRVDPQCLGGVRLDYDGKQLNDTIAHRFQAIRELLTDTVL